MKRKFVTPQKVFTKIREIVQKFKDGFQFTIEIDYCRTDKRQPNNACINKYFYLLFY